MTVPRLNDYTECILAFSMWVLSKTLLAIDYVRYIMDTCENVLVIPPVDIQYNNLLTSPFQESAIPSMEIHQHDVEASETLNIIQLNNNQTANELCLPK
ncbi:unnamed protein product [Didymodactylos carnosus]|uniref:Uncharacterized protein n=1 Tax=Didymodactylos carnosus TaxID=1234261 RepID=A0A814C357_9BILA|nr:unnamed protein product [Didymodactylos carnosus]CAF1358025.1 unnamed protein product [Didymodactylos carnosus]CAF3713390.1 unnamed protein product [Didymodactylos carnosus]CAF4168359.1 unnamed protein product [Didymodactylos carnosus]